MIHCVLKIAAARDASPPSVPAATVDSYLFTDGHVDFFDEALDFNQA
jgi:hypothetical protein